MHSPSREVDVQEGSSTSAAAINATSATGATAPVTLTKSGNVSKMRAHRGNVPTLPQTKFCHLCPAKFTRTTHLNRHLKTHSNERLHECDRCNAQFTRSDLLSRHKRTCCDSSVANRSRRKSCKSCADSKVKCDLQRPCSRCQAKNRDCVYVNTSGTVPEEEPGVPSNASPDANQADSSAASSPRTQSEASADIHPYPSHPPSRSASTSSLSSSHASTSYSSPASSRVVSYTASSSSKAYLSELVSSQMYDGLFADLFTSSFEKNPVVPGQYFHSDPTAMLSDRIDSAGISSNGYVPLTEQLAAYDIPQLNLTLPASPDALQPNIPMGISSVQPTLAELNGYMRLFLSIYLHHMPIVHVPTFLQSPSLPILVTAMRASGAMYDTTPTAAKYVEDVLSTTRDSIIAELSSSNNKCYNEISQLTTASALIQTIGLFHRDTEQRARSNVYHGMIVMMLRMNGFADLARDWKLEQPIDFSDAAATERAWRAWVAHESAKRAIWICYLHDCCHPIFFNLAPTFRSEQFTLGLPCEDALWTAKNATEWAMHLQTPSPYGSIEVRLSGTYLKALYYYLTQNNPDNAPRPFNIPPFAHFLMIYAIMRQLFELYLRDRLPFLQSDGTRGSGGGAEVQPGPHFVDRARAFHVQILLHHWLQSWLTSPETPRGLPESQQRFLFNALPFYWVAQVALVAYQEGLPPFDPQGAYIRSNDAKFYLMKKWERHVRKFLAGGESTATRFWDEVMKIRIETWQAETGFEYEHLLGFFQRDHGAS
ncbi:hypothetical protein TRAPUB_12766 [Trametes pubescens]|uniref:Uncharacterized protein n=1 Tax=Trametes pubescens TaxID=154538 RepID=A0A1M2VT16_TRAPU|nr:hypothetical protein TRAPUB_12766 [Trametes pubescens]